MNEYFVDACHDEEPKPSAEAEATNVGPNERRTLTLRGAGRPRVAARIFAASQRIQRLAHSQGPVHARLDHCSGDVIISLIERCDSARRRERTRDAATHDRATAPRSPQ